MACNDEHQHDPAQCEGPAHRDIITTSARLEYYTVPMNNEDLARWAANLPKGGPEEIAELERLVRDRGGAESVIPDMVLPPAATREARDAFVAYLEFEQEFAATRSRDFGRGLAHAINLLRRAPARES